jgi:tetratricopeptide (TPR) repeat protein
MDEAKPYKAFLSYSHSDQKVTQWLHNTLETYRVPKHLIDDDTVPGVRSRRLGQVFIDRKELSTAGSLSAAVQEALAQSEFLIVICSRAAAKSHWVNQEILEFKRLRGEDNVRCLIVDGEPLASRTDIQKEEECFPPALRYHVHPDGQLTAQFAEPIAADLRPQGDGRRMARLKLIAGLLGVGLDELVQRETQRRYRRMFAATTASMAGMLVMALLTLFAFQARSDAEDARRDAEQRRAQAEDLIEFMLVDLRGKLGPVGRLEVLDAVGTKALDYYAETETEELDKNSLARRARTLHMLGEIQNLRGNLTAASQAFSESEETTAELLQRAPNDSQRIYDHAQSTFWIGYIAWQRGDQDSAERIFGRYLTLAEQLTQIDPNNTDWQVELAYGHVNMGALLMDRGNWGAAAEAFSEGEIMFTDLVGKDPAQLAWQMGLAHTLSWLSSAYLETGNLERSKNKREMELRIYNALLVEDPNDATAASELTPAHRHLARLLLMSGDVDGALDELGHALHYARDSMQNDPENSILAQMAASAYLDQAKAYLADGQIRKARQALARSARITDELLEKDQSILKWQVDLHCQGRVVGSHLNLMAGNLENGLRSIDEAVIELTNLSALHPENQSIRLLLARAHLVAGLLMKASNRAEEADSAWQRTLDILTPLGAKLSLTGRSDLALANFHLKKDGKARELVTSLSSIGYQHPDFLNLKAELGGSGKE